MKRFKAFVKKEVFHILRDKRTLLILFGMPIAQILLFGFAITTELKNAKVAILDQSKDEYSTALINRIEASSYFTLAEYLDRAEQLEPTFQRGMTKAIVVIPPGFAKEIHKTGTSTIQIIADATDPNTANTIVNYLQGISGRYVKEINSELFGGIQIDLQSRMRYNPELKGVYYFVPGLVAILLMLVSAMMTSISIAREKELGTMEVLLVSPMAPAQIILAKVLPYLVLSFIDAIIILTLGKFVFGVPIVGSLSLLLGVTLLFVVLALSLGILISTIAETQQTALLLSLMGLMLPTILLSGFIFPIENMPMVLQVISNIVPAKWFVIVVKSIMLKGAGLMMIWKETLIICLFIFFFIGLSTRKFKIRLE